MANSIGKLNIEIEANSERAIESLTRLSRAMHLLNVSNLSGLKEFTKDIRKLANTDVSKINLGGKLKEISESISGLNFNVSGLNEFAKSLRSLKSVDFSGIDIGTKLQNISASIEGLNFNISGFSEFANSLRALGGKAVSNALTNMELLGDAMIKLFTKLSQAPVISQNTLQMTQALAEFAKQGSKVGTASTKIVKGLDKVDKQAKKTKTSLFGLSKINLTHFMTDLAVMLTGSINTNIPLVLHDALEYASDIVETQNVLERTFGNSIKTVEDFSKTSLEMYGMNELEAKKMIGIFQAMGTGLGETKDRMASVSTSLGALVGDYASFFNMDVSKVSEDFTAIFTGQTKAMRKYGIDLTHANLQEFADSQGWNVQVKSLSQYNKAIIRYNYLVSRSKDIMGDFERTQKSFANQTKVLQQQFKDLMGTLGRVGASVLTPLLEILNALIARMRIFAKQLVDTFNLGNALQFGGAAQDIEELGEELDNVAEAEKKVKTYSVGIDELNVLKPKEDTGDTGLNDSQLEWADDWNDKLKEAEENTIDFTETIEHIKWVLGPTIEAFKRFFEEGLKPFALNAVEILEDLWTNYLEPLAHWTFRTIIPIVIDLDTTILQKAKDIVDNIYLGWKKIFDGIKNSKLGLAIEKLGTDVIRPFVEFILDSVTEISTLAEPIGAFLGWLVEYIGNRLYGVVQNLGAFVQSMIKEIDLSVIVEPLKEIFNSLTDIAERSGLKDTILQVFEKIKPFASVLGEIAGKTLQLIFEIVGKILEVAKPLIDFVAGAAFAGISKILNLIADALEFLSKPLKVVADIIGSIIDLVKGVGGKIVDFVKGLFGNEEKDKINVNVEPKVDNEKLKNEVQKTKPQMTVEPKVDASKLKESTNQAISSMTGTNAPKLKVETALDEASVEKIKPTAQEKIDKINRELEEMGSSVKVKASADFTGMEDAVIEGFNNTQTIVDTKGTELATSFENIGKTSTQSLNNQFINNNPTLTDIITQNATIIKDTFESEKTGVGIKGQESSVFYNYGLAVINGFKSGIEKNKQLSINAVSVWVDDIQRTFVGNDVKGINYNVWSEYAHQIMLGFAEGINTWSYIAKEAVSRWVSEMMAEFEEDCEIESPSKVFKEYGYYVVAGFNEGIKENASSSNQYIDNWVSDIEKSMEAIKDFDINLDATINGLDNLNTKINTSVDMSGFYNELEKAQTVGMNTSLNSYAENKQAIQVEIPNITVEVDSREIARANYKGQKQLGYQIKR